MRLYPPVTKEEALTVLTNEATALWGAEAAVGMANQLRSIAEAMAAVSEVDIPPEVEPMFFSSSIPA